MLASNIQWLINHCILHVFYYMQTKYIWTLLLYFSYQSGYFLLFEVVGSVNNDDPNIHM